MDGFWKVDYVFVRLRFENLKTSDRSRYLYYFKMLHINRVRTILLIPFMNVEICRIQTYVQFIYFFKALGKFIDSSGICRLMINSGLIADGSLRGIIGGTHFNRCKKVHAAAALAFRILHINGFIEYYNELHHDGKIPLEELMENLSHENQTHETESAKFQLKDIFDHYQTFTEKTLRGEHGCTAQFVLMYVKYFEYYQLFEYALRTNDVDMYITAARKMCPLFFTFNHSNYARWLTKNIDDLINMEQSHPGLRKYFENGALSIRRTPKDFCRSPVDLTLEQTINANAANKLTGVTSFTNSLYARQRWNETHTARKAIITHLIEHLQLGESGENSMSLHQNRIFMNHVEQFMVEVRNSIDPFSEELNRSKLFNLSTGKSTSDDVMKFMLNVESNGNEQMDKFIGECQADVNRFSKPIKKNVIKNFTSEILKRKISPKTTINEAKHERNILGQIVCLAMRNSIKLDSVLSFPLTTVPHSIAHSDGTMMTNSKKNELISVLMAKGSNEQIRTIGHDVEVIDGFSLLNSIKESPTKYGLFALFLLKFICKTAAREVHIIFDKVTSPSLRDLNLKARDELVQRSSSSSMKINGPNQDRVSSLAKCLMHSEFRAELVTFLIRQWSTSDISEILEQKRVFVAFGESCYVFSKDCELGKKLLSFQNNHIEVESKIIFHVNKIRANDILVRTSQAEKMLVYLLYNMQSWDSGKSIWMEIGDVSKNTLEQINVNSIYGSLSLTMIKALPAWYIFTGCEYEPSFYGKGRKTCFKHFEKNTECQIAFANFGIHDPSIRDIELIEQYTCQLYNAEGEKVNAGRMNAFQKAYTTKNGIDFSKKGKVV